MTKKKNLILKLIALLALCVGMLVLGYVDAKKLGVNFFEEKVHTVAIDDVEDIQAMGASFHNNICTLEKDITISDFGALTTSDLPFVGVFDGQGHTITFTCEPQYSLFGYIGKEGVVKNLNIIVRTATMDNKKGGILAIENEGQILDCTVTVQSAKIAAKGNYGGVVAMNRGFIKNVIANVLFDNVMANDIYTSHTRLALGGICAYNYGEINSCIAQTKFKYFNETDPQKVFAGDAINTSIGAVYGINNKGTVQNVQAVIENTVYVSDKTDTKVVFKSTMNEVYTEENLFVTLGFNEKKWELFNGEFGLIQGE